MKTKYQEYKEAYLVLSAEKGLSGNFNMTEFFVGKAFRHHSCKWDCKKFTLCNACKRRTGNSLSLMYIFL